MAAIGFASVVRIIERSSSSGIRMGSGFVHSAGCGTIAYRTVGDAVLLLACRAGHQQPGGQLTAQQANAIGGSGAAGSVSPSNGQPPAVRVCDTFDVPGSSSSSSSRSPAGYHPPSWQSPPPTPGWTPTRINAAKTSTPEKLSNMLDTVDRTVGTGFIIDPEGYIVTNEHVVEEPSRSGLPWTTIKVYPALVVGSDPRSTWRSSRSPPITSRP